MEGEMGAKPGFGKRCRAFLGSVVFYTALFLIALLAIPAFGFAALMGGVWNVADRIIGKLE